MLINNNDNNINRNNNSNNNNNNDDNKLCPFTALMKNRSCVHSDASEK